MSKFKQGRKKTGGRTKNTPNKFTSIKEHLFEVFNELQDDPEYNLLEFAKKHPVEFYKLVVRLIPKGLEVENVQPVITYRVIDEETGVNLLDVE